MTPIGVDGGTSPIVLDEGTPFGRDGGTPSSG